MSGFAGIVRIKLSPDVVEADRAAIAKLAEAIAFRGPDAQQQFVQGGVAFAFSLLTTGPAPQAAAQPATVDGETFFLGEARIDGRDDLIRKLQQTDLAVLPATTDEALVLHFVQRFGIEALPELDGDFSFVLWTPRGRKLLAFRDLGGARPLFYSEKNSRLIFSNTLQAVLAGGDVRVRDYDRQFIANFLLGAPHFEAERTVYRSVRRLPAGSVLEFSESGLLVRRIAKFPIEAPHSKFDEKALVEEFRRLLTSAVADRLPEGQTSILLSGGLDSTSVASVMVSQRQRISPEKPLQLHALCIDYKPRFADDEADYASLVAQSLGIPLQIVHSGQTRPFEGWDALVHKLPEPLADPYSLLYLFYRQELSRKARVVLSGDGGDEVLRLQMSPYLQFLWRSRGPLAPIAVLLRWIGSHRKLPPLGFGLQSGILRLMGKHPTEEAFPPWFTPEFEREYGLRNRWAQMSVPEPVSHPFNPQAYRVLNGRRFAEVQELCDPVFTGVALETRNPFLDRRLCRFLLRIPVVPWAIDKHLLRTAQLGVLPEKVRLRRKTPVLYDMLVSHVTSGTWNPVPQDRAHPVLNSIVNWGRLKETIRTSSTKSLYVHLWPLSLSYWLKGVENNEVA